MSAKAFTTAEIVEVATAFAGSTKGTESGQVAIVGEKVALIVEERADIEWLRDTCDLVLETLDQATKET